MAFNWNLRVPYRYQTTYKTLREIETILLAHYHPEYVRRMLAWLHHHNGYAGIGGHWRDDGTQPDKPGFAPEGRSFHQYQKHTNGIYASAVDLITVDGPDPGDWHDGIPWSAVPQQGSVEADRWGLHCNIGTPGSVGNESWHMQWADAHIGGYDLDGWASWVGAGSPGIIPGYPLPAEHDPHPPTDTPDPEEPPMTRRYFTTPGSATALWRTDDNLHAYRVEVDEWVAVGTPTGDRLSAAEAKQYVYGVELSHDLIGIG